MQGIVLNAEWEDVSPESFRFYSAEVARIESMIQRLKDRDRQAAESRLASYVNFVTFLFEGDDEYPGPYMNPLSMQRQLTYDQYLKIIVKDRHSRKTVCETLQRMENYNKPKYFSKERKFLGLTLQDWMQRGGESNMPVTGAASTPVRVRQ